MGPTLLASPRAVEASARSALARWADRRRLHPRIRKHGFQILHSKLRLSEICVPEPPAAWASMERILSEATPQDPEDVLIGDDKDRHCVWRAWGPDVCRYLLQAVDQDPQWARRVDISRDDTRVWMWARAVACLPTWLRTVRMLPRMKKRTEAPCAFPLVKAKSWAASGLHTCTKLYHSCFSTGRQLSRGTRRGRLPYHWQSGTGPLGSFSSNM